MTMICEAWITEVPELTIDSQDENGEYKSSCALALIRRESGFILVW